jgi:hypothetical protein
MAESLKHGCEADRFGVTITSELVDHDIILPIRPFTDNTAESLLNLFMKVAQSKKTTRNHTLGPTIPSASDNHPKGRIELSKEAGWWRSTHIHAEEP